MAAKGDGRSQSMAAVSHGIDVGEWIGDDMGRGKGDAVEAPFFACRSKLRGSDSV